MTADNTPPQPGPVQPNWRTWPQALWHRLTLANRRPPAPPDQARQPRATAEHPFRLFFEYSPDAVLLIDPHSPAGDWPIVDGNDAAGRLYGYVPANLIGRSIDLLAATPTRPEERAAELEQLRRDHARRFEARHRRKDGTELSVESSRALITVAGQELVLETDRDLSEQKRAESQRLDSEAHQRALFEAFPAALWEEDFSAVKARLEALQRQGVRDFETYLTEHPEVVAECAALVKVTNVNQAALRLHRTANKADLLQNLDRALSAGGLAGFRDELVHLIQGHSEFERNSAGQTLTGEALEISLRWSVVPGYEDTLARVLVAVTDNTERKQIVAALRDSEALFRATFEQSPVGIALVSPEGEYLRVNRSMCEMLGYSEAEMVGHRTLEFMHPDDVPGSYEQAHRLVRGEIPVANIEKRYRHRTGRVIWAERVMAAPQVEGERPRYFISLVHDISERLRVEQELKASNTQLTAWLGELEERTREMERLNEMVSLFQTCHSPEEAYVVVDKLAPALFPGAGGALCVVPASRNRVETMATWGEAPNGASVFSLDDCWALRRAQPHVVLDGQKGLICPHVADTPAAYICVPLFAQGEVLGCLHVHTPAGQLSERIQQLAKTVADAIALSLANLRLRESLRQQSIVDVMTGLFNRRYMEETLEREVRRCARAHRPLSIVMLDLDHFKRFNDTHGHAAGDILLGELGSFLRSNIRVEDIACRYGGEEFTLILPDNSLAATAERAEVLRAGIQALRIEYRGQVIGPVTASLGVANFPDHGADGAMVLHAADEALYRAKRAGRNQTMIAGPAAEARPGTAAHGTNAPDMAAPARPQPHRR